MIGFITSINGNKKSKNKNEYDVVGQVKTATVTTKSYNMKIPVDDNGDIAKVIRVATDVECFIKLGDEKTTVNTNNIATSNGMWVREKTFKLAVGNNTRLAVRGVTTGYIQLAAMNED